MIKMRDRRPMLSLLSLAVLVLALVCRYQLYVVSGDSMLDTYSNNQMVLVKTGHRAQRGDVVVSKLEYEGKTVKIIKRVIGIGGDCVEIRHNHLFVNNKRVNESYVDREWSYENGIWVVPEGSYFLLGDNRDDSYDSRYEEVGFVDKKRIIGVVLS